MELEVREVEIREVTDERTVTGLAVPYGQVTTVSGYKERIERGAFAEVSENVTLFYGHDHRTGGLPIGKVVEARETEDGLEIKAAISKTPKGDEVYTLLREGVLNKFSIGFLPIQSKKDGDVIVRTKGDLKEVSIVAIPAYANAAVSEVREDLGSKADTPNNKEDITMSIEEMNSEVAEIREAVSDLERKFTVLSEQGADEKPAASQFRSGGEALQAIAKGNNADAAKVEFRAFTGATLADNDDSTRPAWVNAQLKLVEEKRPVTNLFKRGPLPADGMSYVYPTVAAATGEVGVHTEGADLPYLEVVTGSATADIKVYGGYTSLSRELIERSTINFLDVSLRHLFNAYAKASEKAVRDALIGATGVQTETLDADTAAGWTGLVLDSAALIEDNAQGAAAEVVVVSRDVFRRMATIVDTAGRPLFEVNGDGANTVGSVNVVRVAGSIAGFPVVVIPTLAANSLFVVSSEAITVRDDGIKSLQDENIINLTKDFSVYGYMAVEVNNPLAIVKVDADLVA